MEGPVLVGRSARPSSEGDMKRGRNGRGNDPDPVRFQKSRYPGVVGEKTLQRRREQRRQSYRSRISGLGAFGDECSFETLTGPFQLDP